MKTVTLADLGLNAADFAPKMTAPVYSLPEARKAGVVIAGEEPIDAVKKLVKLLHEEAKVV